MEDPGLSECSEREEAQTPPCTPPDHTISQQSHLRGECYCLSRRPLRKCCVTENEMWKPRHTSTPKHPQGLSTSTPKHPQGLSTSTPLHHLLNEVMGLQSSEHVAPFSRPVWCESSAFWNKLSISLNPRSLIITPQYSHLPVMGQKILLHHSSTNGI